MTAPPPVLTRIDLRGAEEYPCTVPEQARSIVVRGADDANAVCVQALVAVC